MDGVSEFVFLIVGDALLAMKSPCPNEPAHMLAATTRPTPPALLKMRCEASGSSFAIFWGEHQGGLVVVADYLAPDRRADLLSRGHFRSYAEASRDWILDAEGHNPVAKAFKSNWHWRLAGMRKITDGLRQSDARAALARNETLLASLRGGVGKEPGGAGGLARARSSSPDPAGMRGSGCRVKGVGCRVQGVGCRVYV